MELEGEPLLARTVCGVSAETLAASACSRARTNSVTSTKDSIPAVDLPCSSRTTSAFLRMVSFRPSLAPPPAGEINRDCLQSWHQIALVVKGGLLNLSAPPPCTADAADKHGAVVGRTREVDRSGERKREAS